MLRATLKSLLSRKLRLFLSGLAVVLGVMFVAGSLVLTDTVSRSFDALISTAYEDIDVVVSGEEVVSAAGVPETAPVPAQVVNRLAGMPEVDSVVPEIWAEGARPIDNRTGQVIGTFSARLGSNWIGEHGPLVLREGHEPTTDDQVVINAELARVGGFKVGDQIGVLTREPRRDFTVVGIFGYTGDRDSMFGETHVAFTTPVAQELMLGQGDVYVMVSLYAAAGFSPEQLRDMVAAEIGQEYLVQTGTEAAATESDQLREQLGFFHYILLGFAGVALLIGAFLVLNTFSIIVAQRLRELALLRALGASRRQMIGSVLLEATVIGGFASLIGLGLGVGVGAGLAALISLQLGGTMAGIGVPLSAVLGAFGVGLGITLLAALLPALRASRVPPVAAMREAATPDRPLTRFAIVGGVTALAGVTALGFAFATDAGEAMLLLLLVGVLLTFLGTALLTPVLARPVVSALGRVFAWSTPGELGRRNSGRNPRRTAITAAALMVGVVLVTAVSTIFTSLAASLERQIGGDLRAELVIAGEWVSLTPPAFDAEVLAQARQLPEVTAAVGFWYDSVEIDGSSVPMVAIDDLPAWREMAGVHVIDGTLERLGAGQLALDERTADRQELTVGDTVSITLPRGERRSFRVVSIYERNELLEGPLISAEDVRGFRHPNPVEGFVDLREGADVAAVSAELERLLADSPEVLVQDRSGYVEQQTRAFDEVLVYIQMLLMLAMVIAVLGVINTLVLSVIERTRELGLLRAVGLSRAATMRMVTVEAVVISLFGALLGVVVGAGLGSAVVHTLRKEGFSVLALPWGLMTSYLVAAALVGVVAAAIPAIRAARLNVLTAISYE